jgi:hypothetical protein
MLSLIIYVNLIKLNQNINNPIRCFLRMYNLKYFNTYKNIKKIHRGL